MESYCAGLSAHPHLHPGPGPEPSCTLLQIPDTVESQISENVESQISENVESKTPSGVVARSGDPLEHCLVSPHRRRNWDNWLGDGCLCCLYGD